MNRNQLIKIITREAGLAIRSLIPSGVINKEGSGNYVTAGDKKSEEILMKGIHPYFPEDVILSEETASTHTPEELLTIDHLWILDPIDGTANYRYKRNYSSISVGYAEKGCVILGMVYDPFREQTYYGERGIGAFWNEEKIHCNQESLCQKATIVTDNSYDPAIIRKHLETILKITPSPWMQMKGSAALELCEVASGQIDLFFSFCLNPWDVAASMIILEEAGAVIRDQQNKSVNFMSPITITGNNVLVEDFIKQTTQ